MPAAFAMTALFLAASSASSQVSTTRGLSLGFHLGGASLAVEGGDASGGGGGGIRVGYGLNRVITLYAQLDGAQVDVQNSDALAGSWSLAHADIGARFHFANSLRRWVPYLQAAFSTRAVSVNEATANEESVGDVSFSGGAFTFGGGLMFYLSRTWALDADLAFTSGEFTSIDVGSFSVDGLDVDAQSTRFNIGVTWWP
jgi:hypothetical protein